MELILDLLRRLPDYPRLRTALESAQAVGVSGAAQINRSHLIAALCRDTARRPWSSARMKWPHGAPRVSLPPSSARRPPFCRRAT